MSEAPEGAAKAPELIDDAAAAERAAENATTAEGGDGAPDTSSETEAPADGASPSEEAPEEPKRKSPVAQLQGRVGHLTKTLHDKDAALTAANKELETYRALLAAQGKLPEADSAPATAAQHSSSMTPGSAEWQAAVRQEAAQLAQREAFNRDCNAIADQGQQKYGEAFKESVANLNALGMMTESVIQAAMATGAAPDVLNHLGSDVDEAARITALPPVQMAVELTKLASRLSGPKEAKQVSRAPAPITPISGASQSNLDVYDPGLTDDEYYRRRAAQGARFVKAPN